MVQKLLSDGCGCNQADGSRGSTLVGDGWVPPANHLLLLHT